jgi:hypothetical protein
VNRRRQLRRNRELLHDYRELLDEMPAEVLRVLESESGQFWVRQAEQDYVCSSSALAADFRLMRYVRNQTIRVSLDAARV